MIELYKKQSYIVLAVLVFKLILIFSFPLTGDEAYFIKWGNNLSWGYYDHPPMVGWLIYLMSFINDSYEFFRLFSFFTMIAVAYVIYQIIALYADKQKAFVIALIFLVSPLNILLSLFTNDVALLFFGSFGTLFLLYSFEKEAWLRYSLLAGVFLGLAFLSKYFAAFLMISLLIFSFVAYGTRAIKNVLVISAVIILFILQNLYFNYNSCWNNILFNFFARTKDSGYSLSSVVSYFLTMTYIVTPWAIYFLYKSKSTIESATLKKLIFSILLFIFSVFLIVSLKKSVGLHWFLLFLPYIFLLFLFIETKYLQKLFKYNAIFTAVHIVILVGLILFPKSYFQDHKRYAKIIVSTTPADVCKTLEPYKDEQIFTLGYSMASILSYECGVDMKVLFAGSKYGRFDDKLLDVRTLDKQDVIFFDKREVEITNVDDICSDFSVEIKDVKGAKFHLAQCKGFNYEAYKLNYLDNFKRDFYTIPDWLPVGECYFNDRYYRQ